MAQRQYRTPETTVYRKIGEELVVIQLDTSHYYFFNSETEAVLNYFKSPQTVTGFIEDARVEEKDADYIKNFCRFLLEKNILKETNEAAASPRNEVSYAEPKFLRAGEKTLDQITFTSP